MGRMLEFGQLRSCVSAIAPSFERPVCTEIYLTAYASNSTFAEVRSSRNVVPF